MAFELPDLPYAYDALNPYMSAETLEFHHDKHHQAYVTVGSKLAEDAGMGDKSLEEVIKASFGTNQPLFNNAGQVFNHTFFWNSMKPNGGGKSIPGALEAKINEDLGGYDAMREAFVKAGMTQFGSGWAWLVLNNGKLEVAQTPNAETPITGSATPLLCCDVWEHAYYIDYRNARPKFLEAWFDNLANWEHAGALFEANS